MKPINLTSKLGTNIHIAVAFALIERSGAFIATTAAFEDAIYADSKHFVDVLLFQFGYANIKTCYYRSRTYEPLYDPVKEEYFP